MRIALTLLMAAGGIAFASPISAEPASTCPPACNQIPESAWIASAAIPLNARYNWPQLSGLAASTRAPRFRFEEICASPPVAGDPRSYAVAERVVTSSPGGQWQLQAQVVHWRGETWRGGQLVRDTFAAATSALQSCQRTNPAASPSLTLAEPDRFAAAVSGPVILHEYLLADPVSSTLTELALWTDSPAAAPWPAVADAGVLDSLGTPLCAAYIGSCP